MDQALVGFVRALRAAGADASPAETIDAAHALALVGYADREAMKLSLGVVLAKSAAEKQIHDRVFEQFFAAAPAAAGRQRPSADGRGGRVPEQGSSDAPTPEGPERGDRQASARDAGADAPPGGASGDRADDTAREGAGEGAGAQGMPRTGAAPIDRLMDLAAQAEAGPQGEDALRIALARAATAAGVDDIRFASQVGYYTARVLEQLPIAPLDERLRGHLLARPADRSAADQAEMQALQRSRELLQRAARQLVEQRFELYGRGATDAFMNEVVVNRPLGRMSPPDMERMKAVIARMAKRLAVRHARRRRMRLHGQLDFRRTFRANAGLDSVPVDLHFKTRRRDRPRIVVVCDVSGSVASHVRFLLLFLYALQGVVADLKSFAFCHALKDVSPALQQLPFDDAMALILRELGDGATDYGQALADLMAHHADEIDRQTTVIVLGDARSNHANPRLELFAELAERAMRVIWLNPEPPPRWGSGDSVMPLYRPFCTQVRHCASAADLERAIDDTLTAYA